MYKDRNFQVIIDDILNNEEFQKLKEIKHHGKNRLDHSIRVAYYSYKIAKFLKLDYESVARGGMLHDFFYEVNENKSISTRAKTLVEHPTYALKQAENTFDLNDKEKNIIVSHMFPVSLNLPVYAESWIVDLVDDAVAMCELYESKKAILAPATNLLALLLIKIFK